MDNKTFPLMPTSIIRTFLWGYFTLLVFGGIFSGIPHRAKGFKGWTIGCWACFFWFLPVLFYLA